MRDLNGKEVREGDVIVFPTGFGQSSITVVQKVDSGLGVLADASGKVAPAQPSIQVVLSIPAGPSGVLPVCRLSRPDEA